jgi:plasmid maintenance system antidote protein VapI
MLNTVAESRKLIVATVGFSESRKWRFAKYVEDGQRWLAMVAPKSTSEDDLNSVTMATCEAVGGTTRIIPATKRKGPQVLFAIGTTAATADRMAKLMARHVKSRGVPSPGDVLWRDHFAPGGNTYPIMVGLTGISLGHLHSIVNAKVKLSTKVDAKLSAALGTKPGYWLGLQQAFDKGKKKKK